MAVVQGGRLEYEALVFMATLRVHNPDVRVILMEPQPGGAWAGDPRISDPDIRAELERLGAHLVPFQATVFGDAYPAGNKLEALPNVPHEGPFVFFDTDTIVLDSLDKIEFPFERPTGSMNRTGTWPKPGTHDFEDIWRSLYARFDLDFETSLDRDFTADDWRRYLYFNAGFFCGPNPVNFGKRLLSMAKSIWDDPPEECRDQKLTPWLDQIALPLAIHEFGGGRHMPTPGLVDGSVTCHWRRWPLFYAREEAWKIDFVEDVLSPNRLKKLLKRHEPFRRMLYLGKGRALREALAGQRFENEAELRRAIKARGDWAR